MIKNLHFLILLSFFFNQGALVADTPSEGDAGCCPPIPIFGGWFIPNDLEPPAPDDANTAISIILNPGDIVPFSDEEVARGITNDLGALTLSRPGFFQATFAVSTFAFHDFVLDLQVNGVTVPGGRLNIVDSFEIPITVMFHAEAGDVVVVRYINDINLSNPPLPIGGFFGPGVAAYINILQIKETNF